MDLIVQYRSGIAATIRQEEQNIVITADEHAWEIVVRQAVSPFIQHGIQIIDVFRDCAANQVQIVRRRILHTDPRFMEFLGKRLEHRGFKVEYAIPTNRVLRKRLENRIRKKLRTLQYAPADRKSLEAIRQALTILSVGQLVEIDREFNAA